MTFDLKSKCLPSSPPLKIPLFIYKESVYLLRFRNILEIKNSFSKLELQILFNCTDIKKKQQCFIFLIPKFKMRYKFRNKVKYEREFMSCKYYYFEYNFLHMNLSSDTGSYF